MLTLERYSSTDALFSLSVSDLKKMHVHINIADTVKFSVNLDL